MAGPAVIDYAQQPFFDFFHLFHTQGWRAVDLFFCLSGFVFHWLYVERVHGGDVSGRRFAVFRFARLYPLHLATLLAVAVLQYLLLIQHDSFFIYPNNDLYHFVVNLCFATGWGLGSVYSFNGPVWSVSVELLLYAVFFVICRRGWHRPWRLGMLIAGGILVRVVPLDMEFEAYGSLVAIGRGVSCFFIGGITFYAGRALLARPLPQAARPALVVLTAVAWWLIPKLGWSLGYEAVLYPITILCLMVLEISTRLPFYRLKWLGDVSYSTYLWHFPLQLATVLIAPAISLPPEFVLSPVALFGFIGVLWTLALISYHGFEIPASRWLRKACYDSNQAASRWLRKACCDSNQAEPVSQSLGSVSTAGIRNTTR